MKKRLMRFIGVLVTISMLMSLMNAFALDITTNETITDNPLDFDDSFTTGEEIDSIELFAQEQTVSTLDLHLRR